MTLTRQQEKAMFAKQGNNPARAKGLTTSQKKKLLNKEMKESRTTFISKNLANSYASKKRNQGFSVRVIKEKPKPGKLGFYSIDNWAVYSKK